MSEQHSVTENLTTPKSVKPKKKTCRKIACVSSALIGFPLLALTGTMIGALSTESGTKMLIEVADKFSDNLSIGEVNGKLGNGLLIKDIHFQSDGVDTLVQQAHLQLDFGCLWQRKICLEDLTIKQPAIQIDTSKLAPSEPDNSPSAPMHKIHLPISVDVKNVEVQNLSLDIDQNKLTLQQFKTSASLDNEQGLQLKPTQVSNLAFVQYQNAEQIALQEKQQQKNDAPINWQQIEQQLTPALLANLTEIELPFDMQVQNFSAQNISYKQITENRKQADPTQATNQSGGQKIEIFSAQLKAQTKQNLAELQQLDVQSSLGNLTGSGQLQLDQDFPLNLSLQADLNDIKQNDQRLFPATQAKLVLSGNLKQQTQLDLVTKGGANAHLAGQVNLNQPKAPFNLSLKSDSFSYPFDAKNKDEQLRLTQLDLAVDGNVLDYQLNLNSTLEGMGAPKTEIQLAGNGGISQAQIKQLQLKALDGSLVAQGGFDWKNGAKWQADASLAKINLGAYLSEFPAVLSGKLSSTGYANSQDWKVEVPVLDIEGSLSQRPLTLQGNLTASQQELLNVPKLILNYGDNKILAEGQLGEKSNFNLDIQVPNLKGLVPELSASLFGKVKLNGAISQPNLQLDLTGKQIQFQQLKLAQFSAKGNVRTEQQIQGDLNLDLSGLSQGNLQISKAKLVATGNEQHHQLQFNAEGEPVSASLSLSGRFDRTSQQWNGSLAQVNVKSPIGVTHNDKNISVLYDNKQQQAQISAHCWHNNDFDFCLPQNFKAGANGEIPFELKRLNLALVNKLIEQNELLTGQLQSKGKVAWFKDKPLKLDVQINGDNLAVAQKVDRKLFKLALPKLLVNAQLENNNLALKSDIGIQQGKLLTDLKLTDIAKSRKLGGSLHLQGLNLDLANQLLANNERVSGDVKAQLNLAGDLTAPLLQGNFVISQLQAKLKSLPFALTDGGLAIQFHGNRSTLNGNIQTPDGRLNLDGDASWQNLERWNARVRAQADNFLVDIPSLAKVKVSPDVTVKANPNLVELSGNVNIPWARIVVESLPESAVSVSSDEVILTEKPKAQTSLLAQQNRKMAATTSSGIAIKSDLKIHIGDDVTVSAYDLKSELNGLLSVKQEKGQLGLYGQINLKNGRYAAFGQDLLIRKGQISFSGLPSQPLLNIEAIRNPEAMEDANVTAGVKVTGIADSPSVEVFSSPSMSQDQALSYVLTGRSLENSGEAGSSGSVGAALLGMGLAKSGKAVGKLGETFGIQDLNLGTAGVGDSSKVEVSGSITPRLKIKYGVGLFDGLAEVTLRYKLLPQLYLQSVSGVNQAFDLLYQFEF